MHKQAGETVSNATYYLFLAAGLLLPLLRTDKRSKVGVLRTAEALGLSALAAQGIKQIVPAKRPDSQERNSFPSSHTMNTVAVAAAASTFRKKQAPFWYVGAALLGLSRVVLQRHRTREVVAGGLLGYALARLELSRRRGLLLPQLSKSLHDAAQQE